MKTRSHYAKFFFAVCMCGMVCLSCAQEARYLQFVALVQGLINNAEFDISGTVTDMEGNALQDVTLELEFSRPADLWATKYDELHERKTVTGTFSVKKSRYTDVRMTFRKDGYYTEILDFSTPDDDEVAPVKMNNVQVKLRETGTFAEFIERVQGHIEYQIEKKRRIVFGLTKLGEGEMKRYSWPFDRQLSLEKYLFLDFARNPQGEIIYAQKNMRGTVPAPETYILKLVSPDPEDGFISINEQVKDWSYLTDAPDTAYTSKELVLPYNGECLSINRKYYFYIKCGNFYGKGRASTPVAWHDKYHVYVTIMFNEIPGDRNLRSEPSYW